MKLTAHPSSRTEEFFLEVAKEIWGGYPSGGWGMTVGAFPHNGGRTNAELRAYGKGMQDIKKYRTALTRSVNKGEMSLSDIMKPTKKTVNSISWDNSKFFPNFRGIAISKALDISYAPKVRCTSTVAAQERALLVAKEKFKALPETQRIAAEIGVQASSQSALMIDVIEKAGGFMLPIEAMLTELAEFSLENADPGLKNKIFADLFDLNAAAVSVMLDASGIERIGYIDPDCLIIPQTERYDRKNAPFAAWWSRMSIEEIVNASGDMEAGSKIDGSWHQANTSLGMEAGSDKRPLVLHGYLRCIDMHRYIHYAHPLSGSVFSEVDEHSSAAKVRRYGKEISSFGRQMIYKFSWVVGSSFVFNYGVAAPVARSFSPSGSEAMLPIIVYIGDEPSLVERCVAVIDDIQLAVLKRRAFIASIPPGPRISIDMSAVEEVVSLGEEKMMMSDILGAYKEKGVLLYRSRGEFGDMTASNKKPIDSMMLDFTSDMVLFANEVATGIATIRQNIGINEVMDGTANTNDMLIGVMNGVAAAGNKALSPLFRAAESVINGTFARVAGGWQGLIASGIIPIKKLPLRNVIGYEQIIPLSAWDGIAVDVEVIPAETEIQFMQQLLLQRIGEGSIDEGLGMMAMDCCAKGNSMPLKC